jgi:hypothetical protein
LVDKNPTLIDKNTLQTRGVRVKEESKEGEYG